MAATIVAISRYMAATIVAISRYWPGWTWLWNMLPCIPYNMGTQPVELNWYLIQWQNCNVTVHYLLKGATAKRSLSAVWHTINTTIMVTMMTLMLFSVAAMFALWLFPLLEFCRWKTCTRLMVRMILVFSTIRQ